MWSLLSLTSLTLLMVNTLQFAGSSNCPSNLVRGPTLVEYGRTEHCYEFILNHKENWVHAQQDCLKKGGNLIQIRDIQEQIFVMSTLRALGFSGTGVWIGLSDRDRESTFVWVTGDEAQFTYWGQGQGPNGLLHSISPTHLYEDCVLLKFTDSGHWHDYHCSNILFFFPENYNWVCQYQMLTSAFSSTTTRTTTTTANNASASTTVVTALPNTASTNTPGAVTINVTQNPIIG